MERIFEHLPTEALEGILSHDEETLEHIQAYAKAELNRRLALIALGDERNERLVSIREELALIYENDATGVCDALAETPPPNPEHIDERWIVPGSN